MNRRAFVKDAALTLLVLPFGAFLVHCGDKDKSSATEDDDTPPDAPPRREGTNGHYTSSETDEHSHSIMVPLAAFDEEAPVGGISGLTTEAQSHQHRFTIDQEALRRVGEGEIAKIETDIQAEHTHVFTIVKL